MKPVRALIALLLLAVSASTMAEGQSPARVLMLYSYHHEIPWNVSFHDGVSSSLGRNQKALVFYEEYLDAGRFSEPEYYAAFSAYLAVKYRNSPPQVVIADSAPAIDFLAENPDLFGGVQRILFQTDGLSSRYPNHDGAWSINIVTDFRTSLEHVLVLTGSDDVYVIVDTVEPAGKARLSAFLEQTSGMVASDKIHILENQSLPQLKQLVGTLPSSSVVYFLLMFSDMQGKHMTPYQVVKELAAVSSVPVFSHWESLMGSGIVGGYQISGQSVGRLAVRSALAYLSGQEFRTRPGDGFHLVYDWMVLNENNLPMNELARGTVFINRPASLLTFYRWYILTAVVVALALSIVFFFVYRQLLIRRINENMQVLANTDTLTGLQNRRAIHPLLQHEMERTKRFSTPVSMLLIDIDFFKQVNDEHGHMIGDEVLAQVARELQSKIRSADHVCRWGGEEFLVLASSTTADQAGELAEKLRQRVEGMQLMSVGHVTISVGVAQYRTGESFSGWYDRTDSALYRAKHGGRNQVVVA
ncbi:GGDEF domain-containing protein [Thalassolituus marinus]|uniref:diguanylate cyclase n=1 Tax=Thalassolituus marinus TaxID=671053 RepID=A0ABS7ZKN6_9GAMM|nr:GGDEF domain-containing protein [Thalassolituus marinus]MCA6062139.1 GGDEF domain-containing protein [Thalassolituus marinus]